ncbi:condensin complex subunit 1 isoform X1 [Tachysurus fulvidraco]|uniref:condensin complex subunit 1 isoform X1 n=1 Tax=Tachysurus fulvidraco TaxID=1234273 RepID=UPI001FF01FBD|nr:condensin complex subunit 1 isoform X1 [Tachysurus fulvidraco]XP_026999059.2 condensin complex subunit 1 isoform X1 [Tachysurus fulvidraco]
MSWDFVVPVTLDDLLKSGAINQYVVQGVLSCKQLPSILHSLKAALRSQGPLCILEHFDTAYSVLQNFRTVDVTVKEDTLELLIQVVQGLSISLPPLLLSGSLSAANRKEQLNAVKMSVFLLCKLTEYLESDSYRETVVTAPSKGRKKEKACGKGLLQWDSERETVLRCLTQLLQVDIRSLWSLSLVEEEFVSCVTCCCYKLLENPTISHMKSKPTRDAIIHVLGLMVKKYNHMLGACVKVIQLLQHFEQLSAVCAQAVAAWSSEYGIKAIVGEIMREIGQKSSEELAREGSGVKAFSSFLSELSTLVPEIMIPNISVLLTHLDGESSSMRVAVCEVLGEVLVRVLNGDKLDDSGRADRDRFLDTIQEHIHDTHSHVRARVLQMYTRIVNSKALPLCRYTDVMELAVGRLGDKSVNVCKSAIQLVAAFIAHNPYSCKLSSVDLKKPLEKETAKLKEMRENTREKAPVPVISASDLWAAMEPEVSHTVRAQLEVTSDSEREEEDEEREGKPDLTDRDTAVQIAQYLRLNKYRQAVRLCVQAHTLHPESPYFSALSNLNADTLISTLASLFKGPEEEQATDMGATDQPPPPQKERDGEVDENESELKKQEMLVQYLKDTESFALQVESAIAVINNMLYWKTTTVVQEAVQFCVTACEFSVADSVCGVRKMLPLVWSSDAAVKDAVVQAYKRLYLNPHGDSTRAKAQTLVDSLSELMVDASLGTIQCLEEIVQEFFSTENALQVSVVQVLWERFSGKRDCLALHRRAAVLLLGMAARAEREVVLGNLDTLCSVALGEKVTEDYLLARDTVRTITNITDHIRQSKGAAFRLPMDHHLFSCLTQAVADGVILSDPHWQTFMEQAVRLIYFLAESPDQLCARLLQRSAHLLLEQITESAEQSQISEGSQDSQDQKVNCVSLAQLLSLSGFVAFWQVSHLERSVSAELRRRRGEKEEEKEKGPVNKNKREANDSCVEEELGLTGASAEDTEAEFIRKICETELLSEGNMLSVFLPLLGKVCSSPGRYSHNQLTTAACLALSQFMMISPAVCKDNIRLLFTVLEKSPLPVVRANAIIALGDLTVRFPNILEPWTPNLYARLCDENVSVRLTAITVLTQLVLKDVMKVKGQVSEVAALLLDPEPHIANLAVNFFNELAAKDNAIYNLLPDIISRLSDPERGMKEEDFSTVMKQLFSYITKERQTESLVEKLCQRFRTAKTERQWADLAVSLSLLSMCERGFKKLQECWECYSDKLTEDAVYQPLLSILAKLRRRAKPQFKAQVEEFEKKITAVHMKGLENVENEERQQQLEDQKNTPAPKSARRPTRGRGKSRMDDTDLVTPKISRTRPKTTITFSSDEEEEEEDAVMAESETPKVTTPISRTRRTRLRH